MIPEAHLILAKTSDALPAEFRAVCPVIMPASRNYLLSKRIFDIIVSLVFIVFLLSWMLPLLALLIIMDSRGSAFFFQKRIGRKGKVFTCYKLRTMVAKAREATGQIAEDEERITTLGRFLRRSNIDEFPQFFNVLFGHMSLVGPRPHIHHDCARFAAVVPEYYLRHLVKPGMTGLAQIRGSYGPVKTKEGIVKRWRWDVFYVRKANFLFDLAIVWETAKQRLRFLLNCIVTGKGAR